MIKDGHFDVNPIVSQIIAAIWIGQFHINAVAVSVRI